MVLSPYSKINLSLKVNSKLKNGLHEYSIFLLFNKFIDKIKIKKLTKKR